MIFNHPATGGRSIVDTTHKHIYCNSFSESSCFLRGTVVKCLTSSQRKPAGQWFNPSQVTFLNLVCNHTHQQSYAFQCVTIHTNCVAPGTNVIHIFLCNYTHQQSYAFQCVTIHAQCVAPGTSVIHISLRSHTHFWFSVQKP